MRYPLLVLTGLSVMLLASCQEKKNSEDKVTDNVEIEATVIHALPNYHHSDSVGIGSHQIIYAIDRVPLDSAGIVVDEDGQQYRDNRYTLSIKRDGASLFERQFTKRDFRSYLTADFVKYGIMDGMRYSHAEDGKLFFITCVSYPESDMSSQFLLAIGPDGSYTIEPDDTPAEEMIDDDGV